MEHARHVFRVVLVLLLGLIVGRDRALVPHPALVRDLRQLPVRQRGRAGRGAAAAPRRRAVVRRLPRRSATPRSARARHATVSCEVCHAPLGKHVQDGDVVAKMPVDRSVRLCAYCHRKLDGRPAKFPQIVLEKHVDGGLGPKGCLDCHDPHSPKL